jgi:hypothetical protein
MVDHHHARPHGPSSHLGDETAFDEWTQAAEPHLGAGGDLAPDGRTVRNAVEVSPIPGLGRRCPGAHALTLARLGCRDF